SAALGSLGKPTDVHLGRPVQSNQRGTLPAAIEELMYGVGGRTACAGRRRARGMSEGAGTVAAMGCYDLSTGDFYRRRSPTSSTDSCPSGSRPGFGSPPTCTQAWSSNMPLACGTDARAT